LLARIAHELYWIGRQLARAEHTSRMLDGVFHADLAGPPGRPRRRPPVLGRAADDRLRRAAGDQRVARRGAAGADARRRPPDLDPQLHHARREGARTVRDVFSGEMWETINTFHLGLLQRKHLRRRADRPVLDLRVRARKMRPVLGRDLAHDAARRGARVPAGGAAIESADMVLRILRVALPAEPEDDENHLRDGQALALLQAVGGFQA